MKTLGIDAEYLKRIGMDGRNYQQVELDCEICGRRDFELVLKKGKIGKTGQYGPINITQCRHCGHVMINPRFEKQFYVDYYKDFYKDNVAYLGDGNPPDELIGRQQERGARCAKWLAEAHGIGSGRMLDLGCAYGATMIPFRDRGWDVHGIDPEEASVLFAQQKLNLPVVYGFGEDLPYESDSFDLVISLGALEHVHDFHAAMSELNRVIKPGGHVFIRMRHNRPWGVIWEYYNRNHYRFFCGRTHKLALIRYGFDVVEYTDQQIEGRAGDRYLVGRKVAQPSLERANAAIADGLKDSPAELKAYLHSHHGKVVERAKSLLALEERMNGDLTAMAEEIASGRFVYTLLYGYTDASEAVRRALTEAHRVVSESADHGICE